MPLDPGYVGRSFPPTPPYVVGREKIREFAQAIGAEDAVHVTRPRRSRSVTRT